MINFKYELNVVATQFGLHHRLGDRTRSKRLSQELTLLTLTDNSQWTDEMFSDEEVETGLAKAIQLLIDTIPLYRNSDIQFK